MITKTIEKYQARIGMQSCVGIGGQEYPKSFGNYFWLSDGPRIINMWSENLREFSKRNNLKEVECTIFSDGKHSLAIISDSLIPKEWLLDSRYRLCVTGCGWGSRELCEAILAHQGLKVNNEICGCEKPEESPQISQCITFQPRSIKHFCNRCKRSWKEE